MRNVQRLIALAAEKPAEFQAWAQSNKLEGLTFEQVLDRMKEDARLLESFSFAFGESMGEA